MEYTGIRKKSSSFPIRKGRREQDHSKASKQSCDPLQDRERNKAQDWDVPSVCALDAVPRLILDLSWRQDRNSAEAKNGNMLVQNHPEPQVNNVFMYVPVLSN